MRFLATSTIFAAAMLGAQAMAQAGASNMVGTWLTEDGRAKIRTEYCGEGNARLCGYVVWMKQPLNDKGEPKTDIKNPDPAKRTRPSLGLELMSGLKPDDETHFSGEIYNADDGKMYSVTISSEKSEELQVHGCLLRFLCGSQSWARVADLPVPGANKVVATVPATKAVKTTTPGTKHDQATAPK